MHNQTQYKISKKYVPIKVMNQSIVFFTSKYLKFYQDLDNFKIRCSLHKILICKELIISLKADLKETIKKIQYFFF